MLRKIVILCAVFLQTYNELHLQKKRKDQIRKKQKRKVAVAGSSLLK